MLKPSQRRYPFTLVTIFSFRQTFIKVWTEPSTRRISSRAMCSGMSEESYPWPAHPTACGTLEVTVDLRWTHFSFSELTRLSSKRDTASGHVVRQVVLSFCPLLVILCQTMVCHIGWEYLKNHTWWSLLLTYISNGPRGGRETWQQMTLRRKLCFN